MDYSNIPTIISFAVYLFSLCIIVVIFRKHDSSFVLSKKDIDDIKEWKKHFSYCNECGGFFNSTTVKMEIIVNSVFDIKVYCPSCYSKKFNKTKCECGSGWVDTKKEKVKK